MKIEYLPPPQETLHPDLIFAHINSDMAVSFGLCGIPDRRAAKLSSALPYKVPISKPISFKDFKASAIPSLSGVSLRASALEHDLPSPLQTPHRSYLDFEPMIPSHPTV